MKPRSSTLFHFTKNIDFLIGILEHGFISRYSREDIRWAGLGSKDDFVAFPMTCFCDIPLTRISEHTEFYGNYGIGLTKEWAIRNDLSPITYVTPGGAYSEAFSELNSQLGLIDEKSEKERRDKLFHAMSALMSRSKPISGYMYVGNNKLEKDFYQESEWRHIPKDQVALTQNIYTEQIDLLDYANNKLKEKPLKFTPQDIKYIFCNSESEIPKLHDFITTKMGEFSFNDVKILTSRIVAIDALKADM